MNALLDKLKKNTTIKETNVLSESKLFSTKDLIQTAVPALNVALSGKLDGGLTPGLTIFAGPSKHFKTAFSLLMAKSYLDKYKDAALLFYDSEFGTPQSYFDSFGIDTNRVLHTPLTDIEQLKHDKTQVLFHFCGAGIQNSLHAALYHFILQGQRLQYWEASGESIQRKLDRLPSKYIDVIHLFQALLSEHLKIQKNNASGNLVIVIDGLDEAQVAYAQLKISDWFL